MQSHLDELYRRVASVIILVVVLTGIWSLSIDEILHYVLLNLDPCGGSCINIFSPDEWAGTRWLSAALLGLFTAAPFAMVQAYTFARPGLLPSERRAFVLWMTIMWALALIALIFTVTEFLPWLYAYGHSFNEGTGLVGRYDAAEMLRISISITWAIILVLASMSIVMIAGASNLLWSGNAGWWRLRIHGFMLMLLWLVDSEGGEHRVLYVDCSCHGTSPAVSPLKGMGVVSYRAVCRSSEQQDNLLDIVKRFGADKLIFSGCLISSLPVDYIDSLRFLGCSTQTLNLAHLSTIRTDGNPIDFELAMASVVHPWSEKSMITRCLELVENSNIDVIRYGEEIPFGLNLQPNEAWITNPSVSLIVSIEEMGMLHLHCT